MMLGAIIAYAKERNIVVGDLAHIHETRIRKKSDTNELKPFIDGLSNEDKRVRTNALTNLASLVFDTAIETEKKLLLELVTVIAS